MKNIDVIKAFIEGKAAHSSNWNLISGSNALINYRTALAQRTPNGNIIVNITKYSVTTSKIQNWLLRELENAGLSYETRTNVPINRMFLEGGM